MVVGRAYPLRVFHQFGDALRLAFHNDGPEILDVAIAKRVAVHIEGQHRFAAPHLGEGQLLLNLAQGKAVFTKKLNIHTLQTQYATG